MTFSDDCTPGLSGPGAQSVVHGSTTTTELTKQPDSRQAVGTAWSTDYAEVSLLRSLLYARYADILTLCADRPVEALQGDPRRLILTVLVETAQNAVAAGNGYLLVAPAAVLARLQAIPGRAALDAVTTYLPEALAGEVRGAYASTPAVDDVPPLWDAMERAFLRREVKSHGYALVAAAEGGDPSIITAEVNRGEQLRALAVRVGITDRGAA